MPTSLSSRFFRIFIRLSAAASLLMLSACALPNFAGMKDALSKPDGETAVEGVSSELEEEATDAPAKRPINIPGAELAPAFHELSAADFAPGADGIEGLILFSSSAEQPFTNLDVAAQGVPEAGGQLWAITPDGAQAGRISPDDFGGALLPPTRTGIPTRLLQYGFSLDHPALELQNAPEACEGASPACGGFQFSPDGRYLAYMDGPEDCGRTLNVIERAGGSLVSSFPNTRWATFTQESTLLLAHGTCDSPRVKAAMYFPHTDKYSGTGFDGQAYWNADRSAVLIQTSGLPGYRPALWGFHIQTGKIILWMDNPQFMENAPTWATQDEFLFGHRKVRFDQSTQELVLEGPLQILSMNARTRAQRQLAYDGVYNYYLCVVDGVPCQEWYGDWVQVKRTPFHLETVKYDADAGDFVDQPATRCALYGVDCAEPAELMALNWVTGEMLPWDEAGLPEVPDSPAESGPDFNAAPVYEDPDGSFTFFPGLDGRSLWRVPTNGEPEQWVQDGQGFVYLP